MKNGEQPAFPVKPYPELGSDAKDGFGAFGGFNPSGLTKREYFAAIAMQSFIQLMGNNRIATNKVAKQSDESQSTVMVRASIEIADELLKQLES